MLKGDPSSPTTEEIEEFCVMFEDSENQQDFVYEEDRLGKLDEVVHRGENRRDTTLSDIGAAFLEEYRGFAEQVSNLSLNARIDDAFEPLKDFAVERDKLLENDSAIWRSNAFKRELFRIEGMIADFLNRFLRSRVADLENFSESGDFTYGDMFWVGQWRGAVDQLYDYSANAEEDLVRTFSKRVEETLLAGNALAEQFVQSVEMRIDEVLEQENLEDGESERLRNTALVIADVLNRLNAHINTRGEKFPDFPYVFSPWQLQKLTEIRKRIIATTLDRWE